MFREDGTKEEIELEVIRKVAKGTSAQLAAVSLVAKVKEYRRSVSNERIGVARAYRGTEER